MSEGDVEQLAGLTIRRAAPPDHARIIGVVDDWWGGRPMTAMLPRLFLDHFASTSLVVESGDGDLAGFLVGFLSSDQVGMAYVHFAGVSPTHRRRGLAAELYKQFFQLARAAGATQVKAVTSPLNETSQRFHRAIGFAISDPVIDYDGAGNDRVVMTYNLVTTEPYVSEGGRIELPRFEPRIDPRPDDPPWPAASWPPGQDVVLTGNTVQLRPTTVSDADDLWAALDDDRVWAHIRGRPTSPDAWRERIEQMRSTGWWPWTLRLTRELNGVATGAVVGTSSYLEVSPVDARLEIGFTAYDPAIWATAVNPEAKLLLLGCAFDDLGMGRVQLKTDIRNVRSQQAIARLGARYEGVLRRYQRRADDSVRDTVVFSVTAQEWPGVRARLEHRLSR